MVDAAERYREAHPKQSVSATGGSEPVVANYGGVPYNRGQVSANRGQRFRRGYRGSGRGQYDTGSYIRRGSEMNKAANVKSVSEPEVKTGENRQHFPSRGRVRERGACV